MTNIIPGATTALNPRELEFLMANGLLEQMESNDHGQYLEVDAATADLLGVFLEDALPQETIEQSLPFKTLMN